METDGATVGTIFGFIVGAAFGSWFGYLIAIEAGRRMLRDALDHTVVIIEQQPKAADEPVPEAAPGCQGCAANECSGWCACRCHGID